MLQKPPGAIRHFRNRAAAKLRREVGDCLVEVHVGAAAAEKVEQVLAEGGVRVGVHRRVSGWFDLYERVRLNVQVYPSPRLQTPGVWDALHAAVVRSSAWLGFVVFLTTRRKANEQALVRRPPTMTTAASDILVKWQFQVCATVLTPD